jgi:hypothetical protein
MRTPTDLGASFRCVCGYESHCVSPTPDYEGAPSPGDISLCFGCGRVYRFNDRLQIEPQPLAELTPERQKEIRRLQSDLYRFLRIPN